MKLSEAEIIHLHEQYENLKEYFPESRREAFLAKRDDIIQYCVENEIRLYDIVQIQQMQAVTLLQQLLSFFLKPNSNSDEVNFDKMFWPLDFSEALEQVEKDVVNMHDEARPTLGQMYLRNGGSIPLSTLLQQQDMIDLFNAEDYRSDDIVTTEPFSLTEMSPEQFLRVKASLSSDENVEKDVFLAASHDGHWFYLQRKDGAWSVKDSQPLIDGDVFTPRQESIYEESQKFLAKLLDIQDFNALGFETSAAQITNYDCGTQVLNAYRELVDDNYEAVSHRGVMEEVLEIQIPGIDEINIVGGDSHDFNFDFDEDEPLVFSQGSDDFLFDEEAPLLPHDSGEFLFDDEVEPEPVQTIDPIKAAEVIETTVSSQADRDKAELYRDNLHELVHAVVSKGLFAKVEKPIELDKIKSAKADFDESDEEFATRLQEAEFRNAGLKK
ncbi:hypothetical protein BN59_03527 [Legionella massiliensis]|uniref:Uncharacterized protein n=1 Tax=Legionella massiliensis TaxID=1034943 RepID=A0A078L556_9GAMM|nr:hypothetical protein [Legionella massiliensis]CDZ79209.1 hypothetical protein BN59_03527 [Legionella massiliensis]CEE14947.1 hypothetical protein BN1094_03527 [Legionella massiliensis]